MPNPTHRTTIGIAKEATKGTAVAASAFIPVKGPQPLDNLMLLPDQNLRGSAVTDYAQVAGRIFSTFDFSGDVFADTIGWPLAGILGDVVVTGAGAPFTTTFSVLNSGDVQAKSYTLTDFDAIQTRRYPGMQFSALTFKFTGEGMFEYDVKSTGFQSATASNPSPNFSTLLPAPAWGIQASLAGSTVAYVASGEVTIGRPVNPLWNAAASQSPYKVWQGPTSVSGKLVMFMEDETQLNNYLNKTDLAVTLDFNRGAGAATEEVKLTMTKSDFSNGRRTYGKDWIEFETDFVANANTTDAGASGGMSPIKATLQNAIASGTYA